jgi:hypothetical protein
MHDKVHASKGNTDRLDVNHTVPTVQQRDNVVIPVKENQSSLLTNDDQCGVKKFQKLAHTKQDHDRVGQL